MVLTNMDQHITYPRNEKLLPFYHFQPDIILCLLRTRSLDNDFTITRLNDRFAQPVV